MPDDPRIAEYQTENEANRIANERMQAAGIFKPEDLQSGRVDAGLAAQILENAGVDPQLQPLVAEKVLRDHDYMQQAGILAPPADNPQAPEPDRLSQLQAELEAARKQNERYQSLLGRESGEKGHLRRRLRELEDRVRPSQPAAQPQSFVPNMPLQTDPNQPPTMADVYGLMLAQSQAFGNRLEQVREQALMEARALKDYDLSMDEEEDLMDSHSWLKNLPTGQREQAMLAIARSSNGKSTGSRQLTPQRTSPEEVMRARVRETAFIPAPSRASVPEQKAQPGSGSAMAELRKKYDEAISKPGGSVEAERLLKEMGVGRVDDQNVGVRRY